MSTQHNSVEPCHRYMYSTRVEQLIGRFDIPECPVCLYVWDDEHLPVLFLPCFHTLCTQCHQALLRANCTSCSVAVESVLTQWLRPTDCSVLFRHVLQSAADSTQHNEKKDAAGDLVRHKSKKRKNADEQDEDYDDADPDGSKQGVLSRPTRKSERKRKVSVQQSKRQKVEAAVVLPTLEARAESMLQQLSRDPPKTSFTIEEVLSDASQRGDLDWMFDRLLKEGWLLNKPQDGVLAVVKSVVA